MATSIALVVLVGGSGGSVVGGDEVATSPSPLERQVQQQLGTPRSPETSTADVATIPERMESIGRNLAAGETDAAVAGQQRLLALLDQLLNSAPPTSQSADQSSALDQQLSGARPGSSDEQGRQQGAPGSGAASEASSRATPGGPRSSGVVERRRGLATAVWGHLPDREREQMLQSYDDEFLPEYAELVESYYEALAAERLAQPVAK